MIELPPITAEGLPLENIEVYEIKEDSIRQIEGEELKRFADYFDLENKGLFNKSVFDMISKQIEQEPSVSQASYKVYNQQFSGPITVRWFIRTADQEKQSSRDQPRGLLQSGKLSDLPLLAESSQGKLTFFLNGGLGFFLDQNAFFGKGAEFTQGNPVADQPAGFGPTYWSETFLEPGLGGITQWGQSNFYPYGALSGLFSARIGSDIFSEGSTSYGALERAYLGFLWAKIGPRQEGKLDFSIGRNFFQLNDGFLFSRYSGSANAGERGSVYLSSRTAFEKTVLLTYTQGYWTFNSFFLEPQELFTNRQSNTNYTGLNLNYNNQKLDLGIAAIQRTGGTGSYRLPQAESISRRGLWTINPKFWISDLWQTGLFLKSEYAWQIKSGMQAQAWYLGGGIKKEKWKFKPTLYYRYAFMQGDDPSTAVYERFDPLLTGGLGNWVQGLNFRKVIGTGNIISHRVELSAYLAQKLRLSLDAFYLQADELNNLGGLAPLTQLSARDFGQEYSLTAQYSINSQFLLLGVFSTSYPGAAIRENLPDSKSWQTYQLSIFIFI